MYGDYNQAQHTARVLAAGGSVPDNITTDKVIKYLKERGAYPYLSEGWIVGSGVKIGGNPVTASDIYGIRGLHDLTQGAGAAQPLYAGNALTFDGDDDTLFKTGITKTQLLSLTDNGDFTFVWVGKIPYGAPNSINIVWSFLYTTNNRFYVQKLLYSTNKIKLNILMACNGTAVTTSTSSEESLVYDENSIIQITVNYVASTGVATSYIDGVSMGVGNNSLPNINNLVDAETYSISFSRYSSVYDITTLYGAAMFRGILTPQQCKLEV